MDTATSKVTVVSRRLIETRSNVWVNVPLPGKYMIFVGEFTLDGQPPVPAHHQHGVLLQGKNGKIIVYRHFYVSEDDLGTKICAEVEVWEKTMSDGGIYVLENITPCEPDPDADFFEMRFRQNAERGTLIPPTDFRLQFNKKTAPPK